MNKTWEKENMELWESEILSKAYQEKNYKEIMLNAASDVCVVFFSSNGLYYPNTIPEFEETVVRKDWYEWENVAESKEIAEYAGKLIFIRDIYKQWYVKGISRGCDSIDAMLKLLFKLTRGYRVITAGGSSGGYAAVLFGCMLHAERVYSFSGQFSILDEVGDYYWLSTYMQDTDRARHYDLLGLLEDDETPIFYFYPAKCVQDIMQYHYIENMPCIYAFAFDCDMHGKTMDSRVMPRIICQNEEKLQTLCHKYGGKLISREGFDGEM